MRYPFILQYGALAGLCTLAVISQFYGSFHVDVKAAERGPLNDYVIQFLDDVAAHLCLGPMTYSSLIVDRSDPELPKPALVGS